MTTTYYIAIYVVIQILIILSVYFVYKKFKKISYIYEPGSVEDKVYHGSVYNKIAMYVPALFPIFNLYYPLGTYLAFKRHTLDGEYKDVKFSIYELNKKGMYSLVDLIDYTYSNNMFSECFYLTARYVQLYAGINTVISEFVITLVTYSEENTFSKTFVSNTQDIFLLTAEYFKGKGLIDDYNTIAKFVNDNIYKQDNGGEGETKNVFRDEPNKDVFINTMLDNGIESDDKILKTAFDNRLYKISMELCIDYYNEKSYINGTVADIYYKLIEIYDENDILYADESNTLLLEPLLKYLEKVDKFEKCATVKKYIDKLNAIE